MRVWGLWSACLCPPIQHCVHVLCGFPPVFVSFVCLLSSAQPSGYQGSVGLWHGPWSRMGSWAKGERGSFPYLTPHPPPPGHFRSLS